MTTVCNYIFKYKSRIDSGKQRAGKWIKIIFDLLVKNIKNGTYIYDAEKAEKAINFIENFCHHSKGRNDLIKLELWEKAIISAIFGLVDEENRRIFREIFVVVARKNGKSLLASAIIAYTAYMEDEYGQEIYCLAPKLEQAAIVYDGFYQMVLAEPELSELAKKRRSDIYIEESNTVIKPIAFNAKKSDGFNPKLVICDELAAWQGDAGLKQYEVMKSAVGSRTQPLIVSITTSGYVNDGIYDELYKRSTAFLLGNSKETRLLPFLFMIDEIEKWNDIDELKKSNPNWGVSVFEEFFREEIAVAEQSLSKKAEFITKYGNLKQNSTSAWLQYEIIDDICGHEAGLEDFRNCYCVGGIDLSQTTDLTSCCVLIERDGLLHTFSQFFMPENKIDELQEREGVPYRIYQQQGFLISSGENYVDYNDCYQWFIDLVRKYRIYPLKIGYDRYSAQYLVQQLSASGFQMDDVYQGENLTSVIREAEGLIRDKKINLGKNNLLKAHFLNTAMKTNTETRRIRPVKIDERSHIDGFVAVIDALTVRQKWNEQIGAQLKNIKRSTS